MACRQLGMQGGTPDYSVRAGQEPTWLDDLQCRGTEDRIDQCRHRGWGREDCSHREDVGVICYYSK